MTTADDAVLEVEGRFAIVPEWVLDADVSDAAVRLYAVLLRYGQTSGARVPSRRVLADRLRKKSTDTVDRAMRELVALGAVVVEHRRHGQVQLSNRYLVRTTQPGGGRNSAAPSGAVSVTRPTPPPPAGPGEPGVGREGGRKSAAPPGRRDAARGAAPMRPNPKSLTQRTTPPPPTPSTAPTAGPGPDDHDGGADGRGAAAAAVAPAAGAEREARHAAVLARLGLPDLDAVTTRCRDLRAAHGDPGLGDPGPLWSAPRLLDALARAVLDDQWPADHALTALQAVAADPATRSPMRLTCPGPWWAASIFVRHASPASRSGTSDELDAMEADLAEAGGLRVALQRQAREQLDAEGVRPTRASVTRRAHALLLRRADLPAA